MEKNAVRALIRTQIATLSPEVRGREDREIINRILENPYWQKSKNVFCYISRDNEINTYPLLEAAISQGKTLAAPFVTGKGYMEARQLTNLSQLQPDDYGILAPPATSLAIKPEDIELVIVPGLAFEKESLLRLGQGGGFYDRYLAGSPAFRLAPARTCQIVNGIIPKGPYDLAMDMLITPDMVYIR